MNIFRYNYKCENRKIQVYTAIKLTYKLPVNWTADKMHTYNRIGKYLRTYAVVDAVMLTDKLALLGMDFQWHASIHCTMN